MQEGQIRPEDINKINKELKEKVSNNMMRLSENLRSIRTILGLSCEEFAQYLGTTKQTISNLECMKHQMSGFQYIAIRTILDRLFEELGYESFKSKTCIYLMGDDAENYNPSKWIDDYITSAKI
jgi:DNA-binding transcriptional regulator YiaG